MGRQGSITIETLLQLCDAAYLETYGRGDPNDAKYHMPRAFEENPRFFDEDNGGWERIGAIEYGNGLRIFALYNERTNSVIVVNRGTRISVSDFLADEKIYNGISPQQFHSAGDFLRDRVWKWMKENGHANAQVLLTGHSLGGALAQLELAAAHRDPGLQGMNAFAVTFAALGARDAIKDYFKWRAIHTVEEDTDEFARTHLINFVREGDGYPFRGQVHGPRSRAVGTVEVLGGLYMDRIKLNEDIVNRGGILSVEANGNLAGLYFQNHSLRSYYRPDFSRPWQASAREIFRRRGVASPF